MSIWSNPKLDWKTNPKNPTKEDFNRIEENIDFLKTDIETKKGAIVDAMNTVGLSASLSDTHSQLAGKITGANQGSKILMPGSSNVAIPKGFHSGQGYVYGDVDLRAENIKYGVVLFGIAGEHFVEKPGKYDWVLGEPDPPWDYVLDLPTTLRIGTFTRTVLTKHIQIRWGAHGGNMQNVSVTFDIKINGTVVTADAQHDVYNPYNYESPIYDLSNIGINSSVWIDIIFKTRQPEEVGYVFLTQPAMYPSGYCETPAIFAPEALY
jgi:hypothetical protein